MSDFDKHVDQALGLANGRTPEPTPEAPKRGPQHARRTATPDPLVWYVRISLGFLVAVILVGAARAGGWL